MDGEKYKKLAIIVLVLIIGSVVSLSYILNYKIDSKSTSNSTVQSVKKDEMNSLNVPEQNSPLFKKTFYFLGLWLPMAQLLIVDMIPKETSVNVIKNATSGTTFVEIDELSYVGWLKKIDKEKGIDLLVTQLSTNDAEKELELGEMIESFNNTDFDT